MLAFVKTKWRNRLQEQHTQATLRAYNSPLWPKLGDVPYASILKRWADKKERRL